MTEQLVKWNYRLYIITTVLFAPAALALALALLGRFAVANGSQASVHFNNQLAMGWWWLKWTFGLGMICGLLVGFTGVPWFYLPVYVPSFLLIRRALEGLRLCSDVQMNRISAHDVSPQETEARVPLAETLSPQVAGTTLARVGAAKDIAEEKIREVIPMIRAKAQEILGKTGATVVEFGVERLLGRIHGLMPFPFRIVVRKRKFIAFCLQHEELVFGDLLKPM